MPFSQPRLTHLSSPLASCLPDAWDQAQARLMHPLQAWAGSHLCAHLMPLSSRLGTATLPSPVFLLLLLSGLTLIFSIPNFFSCYLLQLFHFVLAHGYMSIGFCLSFGGCCLLVAWVLVSQPGIGARNPCIEAWSLVQSLLGSPDSS